jgi:cytoskeleton protein RodZ
VSPDTKDEEYAHSVGELLRSTREAKKLSLSDVHRDTRMSLQVLRALEQDDFAAFESDTYLKGFLKSYAKYLGLEADEISRRLDKQRGGAASSKGTTWDIEESIREEKLRSPRILTRIVLPVMLVIIVVLAILLALERRKVQELRSNLRQVGRTTEAVQDRPV